MPDKPSQKGRILFLERYLMDHTDDNHMISTDELIRLYMEHGYAANRNTVRDDIAVLNEVGFEVIGVRVGQGKSYHIGERTFELAELKMLVDAVSSSRFISARWSDKLIQKLVRFTNVENRPSLTARVYPSDRLKSSNPSVLQNIDTIRKTIDDGKKLSFQYWDYNQEKEKILRHDGEVYVVSPYALIWDDDRYYLAAYSDKREKIVTFRVDRICNISQIEEAVHDQNIDVSEYTEHIIHMYDGDIEETTVILLSENRFMQNILDRFGEETETEIVDKKHFQAAVVVRPSSTFFAWVFQFGGGIKITAPGDIMNAYIQMLKTAAKKPKKPRKRKRN